MNTKEPPLRIVGAIELYEKFWGDCDSIKQSLLYVLEQIEESEEVQEAAEFIRTYQSLSPDTTSTNGYDALLESGRETLNYIS